LSKICFTCKAEKSLDQFHKAGKYHRRDCKICRSDNRKKYSNGRVGKEAARRAHLQARYGLSIQQRDQMEINQRGRCAICFEVKTLYVDHCHSSNKVRGLLCHTCNAGLGMFKDNVDFLKSAINYL
jgi:hypothetical protein